MSSGAVRSNAWWATAVVAAAGGLLVSGCSGSGSKQASPTPTVSSGALASSCGDLPGPLKGVSLPKGLTTPAGMVLYTAGKLGKNNAFQLRRKGTASEVGALLNEAVAALEKGGFTVSDKQQTVGRASSATFSGPVKGNLTVAPLCEGQLTIRYAVAP